MLNTKQPTQANKILSGIQPSGSGDLHLGNYFGAIEQHIAFQHEGECHYFIADYHALTIAYDLRTGEIPGKFDASAARFRTMKVAAAYIALGLDPARALLFRQSDVPEVTELAWLLACVTGQGLLERAHAFKDKVARGIAPGLALFIYPVLMAADILAYDADIVPVGDDQSQHLEMTRDMARGFNDVFGECFTIPATHLSPSPRVPGTDGQKMSKSYGNTIPIFASGKVLRKLVMGIVTDSTPVEAPKDPDRCNAFALYSLFADTAERTELAQRYRLGGIGYGEVKQKLYERIEERFATARLRYEALLHERSELEDILRDGALRARARARNVLDRARTLAGLGSA
jgi:tryptophanyl-tRNA synthetase